MARGGPERLDAVGLVVGASPVGPGGSRQVGALQPRLVVFLAATLTFGSCLYARPNGAVSIDWVTVGDPGNAPDDTGLGEDLRFADSRRRSRPAKENEPNGRWGVIDRLSASARAKQP